MRLVSEDFGASRADPPVDEIVRYAQRLGKPTAAEVLRSARAAGRVATQPRCGVGDHARMLELLVQLETGAQPDVLTVTIDSHTRLNHYDSALRTLNANPAELNGYPLVTHGWERGRELNESVRVPLEVRHGSPDPRVLFRTSVAAGITSFEGGPISYNLPYSKDVPIVDSLAHWREVDAEAGELAHAGLVLDRELFGTLTAVLVPPSISLAISVVEAVAAARQGVRCLSIAYPQGGNLVQDVAALRAIPRLAERYLPPDVEVFPVLHEFMGAFPRIRANAEQLIFYGAVAARLGGAAKIVTKTHQEAAGIPDPQANIDGIRLAAVASSPLLDFIELPDDEVEAEIDAILLEVAEILAPVLEAGDLERAIVRAFGDGVLDIPFSASRHAKSEVVPARDECGAIRYHDPGKLRLSDRSMRRNRSLLDGRQRGRSATLLRELTDDINYFPILFGETPSSA